ncbi:MAG: hypothetical protein WBA68_07275 [Alteraurantiacibacter sp.]
MFDDPFAHTNDSPIAPSEDCFAITPDDAADLPRATKAIYVGEGGDVTLVPVRGEDAVTFRNLPAGAILDVRVRAVRAIGTTASAIVGLA